MRSSSDLRIWIALGVLLFLVFVASLFGERIEDPDQPELRPVRSTYRSRPSGLRALYLTLDKLGYRPRRLHQTPEKLPGDGALVIAEPPLDLTEAEWQALTRWVERGNLLLLYSETGRLFDLRRPQLFPGGATSTPAPVQPVPIATPAAPVIRSPYRIPMSRWRQRPLIPLYADGAGTALSYARWGKGAAVLACSPWSLSNEGIAQGGNLALFLNLLDAYGHGKRAPVYFDEYHQGLSDRGGPMSLLAPVARFGVWQLGVALLLLVLAVAWRFGGVVPVETLSRRSRAEYLEAMTGLFRRARALELVARKLEEESRRGMARALGLPPTARPEAIAAAAQERRGLDARHLLDALQEADALAAARDRQIPVDERRLLAVAARLHDLRQELTGWKG